MFGLDHQLAGLSDGTTLLLVAAAACLLGLRHAADPDHVAAVATLMAGARDRCGRAAGRLGLAWGAGHATTLFAFGLPIVLFKAFLPEDVQRGAETAVGLLIIALAAWLLVRWRRGLFHLHLHEHDSDRHVHGHSHVRPSPHAHDGLARARTPLQAYAVGLVHGMGGSAGVGVLLLATIHNRWMAVGALALFAACTALSMAVLSTSVGLTLSSKPVRGAFYRLAPVVGLTSLAFGIWYSLGALDVAPYVF